MKFIVLLVVLGLRRLDLHWPHWLVVKQRLEAQLPGWRQPATKPLLSWLLAVLLPTLVIALVLALLDRVLWGIPSWFAGGLLLLWLWGAKSEFRQVEELLALGRLGDRAGVERLAAENFAVPAGAHFFRRLQQRFLMRDARVLFASIMWLMLLGYWAVFLYLANRLFVARVQPERNNLARLLDEVMFYPVARLLVICLALTADFRAVMHAVAGQWLHASGEQLLQLAATGVQASTATDTGDELPRETARLEQLHAALLRALALWLVVAAVWVMLVY